jgi:NAD(P)-dependent dehydrogenase (short-subunit alcohol dehydrogenase family)
MIATSLTFTLSWITHSSYSAAKSAIDAYGRVAAMELAPHGIRVNSLSPGATATPIFWSGSPGSVRGQTLSAEDNRIRQRKVEANIVNNVVPLRIGRSGTGKDIARAALFLASDDSEWVTGQDMIVDGGLTAFDAPNKGWMADVPRRDPVPLRHSLSSRL